MKYNKGDSLSLKVADSFGYRDKVFSCVNVMVLAIDTDCDGDNAQYICYVPSYERIPYGFHTFPINRHHVKHFKLDDANKLSQSS